MVKRQPKAESFRVGDSFAIPECICGGRGAFCISGARVAPPPPPPPPYGLVTITGPTTAAVQHGDRKRKARRQR